LCINSSLESHREKERDLFLGEAIDELLEEHVGSLLLDLDAAVRARLPVVRLDVRLQAHGHEKENNLC
jgi:hypothetical protein